jgi:hypothetical protein
MNVDPLGGAHETDTGAVPPVTVGERYVTVAEGPLLAATGGGSTGHAIAGGGMMTVLDGRAGVLHAPVSNAAAVDTVTATPDVRKRM